MACPSDPEVLRPKNYSESISGDQTWDRYGIRVKWTDPVVPGNSTLTINEPLTLRLGVEVKKGHETVNETLSAWCWTHIRTEDNTCGIWREIRLLHNPRCSMKDDHGNISHVFQSSIVPTADDLYRLTFNVKYEKIMIWANYFQVDNMVDIHVKPSVGTQFDSVSCPHSWKICLSTIVPQTISFYARYFSSLFPPKDNQQSTSANNANRDAKSVKKKKVSENDDVEMLVML